MDCKRSMRLNSVSSSQFGDVIFRTIYPVKLFFINWIKSFGNIPFLEIYRVAFHRVQKTKQQLGHSEVGKKCSCSPLKLSKCCFDLCCVQVSMALCLSSPSGCPYDEDEDIAVLESTAAEYRCPSRPRLPEISVISPGLDSQLSITEAVSVNSCLLLLSWSIISWPGILSENIPNMHTYSSKTYKCMSVHLVLAESGSSTSAKAWQRWWRQRREDEGFSAHPSTDWYREKQGGRAGVTLIPPLCKLTHLYLWNVVHWFCVLKVHLCFQGCVAVQNDETLLLKAPKESQNMKTAERGITQSMHKFSFTKVGMEVGSL